LSSSKEEKKGKRALFHLARQEGKDRISKKASSPRTTVLLPYIEREKKEEGKKDIHFVRFRAT